MGSTPTVRANPSRYRNGKTILQITLNVTLTENPYRGSTPIHIANMVASKLGKESKPVLIAAPDIGERDVQQNYLEMASSAYSAHHAVRIAPHDLWYIVLCEIASTVNANSDAFRSLFTQSNDVVTIEVMTADPTYLPLDSIIDKLRGLVPGDVDQFIPDFSTHTEHSRFACYAAFADTVKTYYSYMTFCCGLPAVEIAGTVDDWKLFATNLSSIAEMVGPIGNRCRRSGFKPVTTAYFDTVLSRVQQIIDLAENGPGDGREDFVKDFYSQRNVGSGGQKHMSGWLGEFFVEQKGDLANFNPCLSVIPYRNLDTQQDYTVVYGAFYNTVEDGFRVAQYGGLIFRMDEQTDMAKKGVQLWSPKADPEYEGRWPTEAAKKLLDAAE